FDSLEPHRAALVAQLRPMLEFAQAQRRVAAAGQGSLFAGTSLAPPATDSAVAPWEKRQRLQYEKETLGLYLDGHPLDDLRDQLAEVAPHSTRSIAAVDEADSVRIAGVVTRFQQSKIRSGQNAGRMMARFVLEDLEGG